VVVVGDFVGVHAVLVQRLGHGIIERLERPPAAVQEVVTAGVDLAPRGHARHGADVLSARRQSIGHADPSHDQYSKPGGYGTEGRLGITHGVLELHGLLRQALKVGRDDPVVAVAAGVTQQGRSAQPLPARAWRCRVRRLAGCAPRQKVAAERVVHHDDAALALWLGRHAGGAPQQH
jgi:hypothetical protein